MLMDRCVRYECVRTIPAKSGIYQLILRNEQMKGTAAVSTFMYVLYIVSLETDQQSSLTGIKNLQNTRLKGRYMKVYRG